MEQSAKPRGGRPWSFDRDAAVHTAMLLFWRYGYEGVSIEDLTKAIGVAPPSLYAAFGSKAGLYRQALSRYKETLGRLDVAAIASATSLSEAVRSMLEAALKAVTQRERERGCMISSGLVACHPGLADIARDTAAQREVLRKEIMQALSRFAENNELQRLARHLAAVMQGMSIQARDGVTQKDLQDIVEDVVEGVMARFPLSRRNEIRETAEHLRAPLQVIPEDKHLNAETGMTTFPELATDLDALLAPSLVARPGGR